MGGAYRVTDVALSVRLNTDQSCASSVSLLISSLNMKGLHFCSKEVTLSLHARLDPLSLHFSFHSPSYFTSPDFFPLFPAFSKGGDAQAPCPACASLSITASGFPLNEPLNKGVGSVSFSTLSTSLCLIILKSWNIRRT